MQADKHNIIHSVALEYRMDYSVISCEKRRFLKCHFSWGVVVNRKNELDLSGMLNMTPPFSHLQM